MFRTPRVRLAVILVAVALGVSATACAKKNSPAAGGSGSGLWVKITSPANQATVTMPLTVKLDASVPLGDPSTGEHHVHICVDGASCDSKYTLAYSNSVQITGLSAGVHTLTASLRNADHSNAGPTTTITVTVGGSGTGGGSPSATATSSGRYGY